MILPGGRSYNTPQPDIRHHGRRVVASDPKSNPAAGGPADERAKMMRVLVPAAAVAVVVVLVAVIAGVTGRGERKMSDGSDGTSADPELKDAGPGVRYRDLR